MRSRSAATRCSTLGRSTLTATTRPSWRRGPVHHGDGGPPDRDVFEVGEHVTQGAAKVFLDPLAHIDEGDGRPRVQARPELVGHLVTEHPR